MSHDWHLHRDALGAIAEGLHAKPPGYTAAADHLQAQVRDLFDAYGLPITHEDVLYSALTTTTALLAMARNSTNRGYRRAAAADVEDLIVCFIAAIYPYLPAEATR